MIESDARFVDSRLPRVVCLRSACDPVAALPNPDAILIRTADLLMGEPEKQIKNPDSYYRAAVCLRSSWAEIVRNDRAFFCGLIRPGMFHVSEPNITLRGSFKRPAHGIHLLFSASYVDKLRRESPKLSLPTDSMRCDVELGRLAGALANDTALRSSAEVDGLYLGGLTAAILGRLMRVPTEANSGGSVERIALPKWRLLRVQQYVAENLPQTITLADLANASGLSRMHFAAQFRRATGLRPHEFVLKERIDNAKRALSSTDLPLIQIAMDVGFQTHSHFSANFKRIVGISPMHWRAVHK